MNWLNPGMAWWLLLVPALVALYMFRPRSVRKAVSSLRLWQALPQVDRPKARLRRPPLSLLLLMQALLLLAGALALMQPALAAPAGRHLVIVLDASGSMQAADGGSSRFEQAKSEAHSIVSGMKPLDRATLLRAGSKVTTLCSACKQGDLDRALSGAEVGAGRADIGAALGVAAGLARRSADGSVGVVVISDGGFEPVAEEDLPPLVRFVQVGNSVDNVAVTALSARQPADGTPGYSAFARVDNKGTSQVAVEVRALADTVPQQPRQLTLPTGGHADLIWQVPVGTVRFTVNLTPQDTLAADNQAVIFLPSGEHKVLIKSGQPDIYSRALAGVEGLEPVTGQLAKREEAAFTVIEGRLPETLPLGGLLLVNPEGTLLPSSGDMENLRPLPASPGQALLDGVDLRGLIVQKARKIDPPAWLEPVVQAEGGPLLLSGEQNGRRVIVLAFDPHDSNLPKLAAFPLLMANVADWLYPLAGTQALRPGESIGLPAGSTVIGSDGQRSQVDRSGLFAGTDQQGVYRVEGTSTPLQFAVNMVDGRESDLEVRAHSELDRQASRTTERLAMQEYWSPLAAIALALVGGEWLYYCWKRGQM